jgi:prepilin-type N-terminal cleavage/methylation domain-containing protein
MRTSATGPSDRFSSAPPALGGFTLVEVLVVMVILATLAGAVSLSLPDDRLGRQQAAVEGWYRQAQWAADRSLWQGRPHAWEVGEAGARVLVRRDGQWTAPEPAESRPYPLPDGLRVTVVENEGQVRRAGERIVFRGGDVPLFDVRLESSLGSWRISGNPGGRIDWQRLTGQGKV